MLSETCFEYDFNLTDILCNIDDITCVTNGKKADSNGNLSCLNLSFAVDKVPTYGLTTGVEHDAPDDDLCELLNSCHAPNFQSAGHISLAALAKNHFSGNFSTISSRPEKCSSDRFISDVKIDGSNGILSFDCLDGILLEENYEDNKISNTEDLLSELNWENSVESREENKRSNQFECSNGISNDEVIPDINLSVCIKNNIKKDQFSFESSSPDSTDSGFGEIDLSSLKTISSISDESSSGENLFGNNKVKSNITSLKHSLLSRAISARPRTDKSKIEKLKSIRMELLKKYFPQKVFKCKLEQKSQKFEQIIDQSDRYVVTSRFMKAVNP